MKNKKTIGVDIGNTSIKSAEFFPDGIGEIRSWMSLEDLDHAYSDSQMVVSSVGLDPISVTSKLDQAWLLNHETLLPITLSYETPNTLGADRIAGAVGAWARFPEQNILIVDGGTCITYDLVTADGVFQGGMISPGLDMRLKAMHHFTNALPLAERVEQANEVGKSTNDAVWLGASVGLKNEIEGVLSSFNKKYDALQTVVTGGLANDFESNSKARIFASSKIVLEGLQVIWKFNEAN